MKGKILCQMIQCAIFSKRICDLSVGTKSSAAYVETSTQFPLQKVWECRWVRIWCVKGKTHFIVQTKTCLFR